MQIIFDSGVLISFSETCLLPVFGRLKEKLGEFIITKNVKFECIGKVQNIMRFKLSALRIEDQLKDSVFKVYKTNGDLEYRTKKILEVANKIFYIRGNALKIIHIGEAECLALLGLTDASYLAVDERTTRMLIEQPRVLIEIFKRKYKTNAIKFDNNKYMEFKDLIKNVQVIRSVDLLAYAYKNSLLGNVINTKEDLKAALYALKFKGCSVSFEEINEYIKEL